MEKVLCVPNKNRLIVVINIVTLTIVSEPSSAFSGISRSQEVSCKSLQHTSLAVNMNMYV